MEKLDDNNRKYANIDDGGVSIVPKHLGKTETKSKLLYLFSFLTISLASGMVYGWPSLRRKLVSPSSHTSAVIDERTLGAIFTVGSWSTQGSRFFFGIARDRWLGTRLTTCISLTCAALGIIGIAIYSSPPSSSDMDTDVRGLPLAISMFLVGLGSGSQLCLQPVANLFKPNVQGTILSSLSGAFQISGLVFLVLTSIGGGREDNGKENGLKISFGVFGGMLMAFAGIAMVVLPRRHFMKRGGGMGLNTVEGGAVMDDRCGTMEKTAEKGKTLCSDTGISGGDSSVVELGNGDTTFEVVGAQTGNDSSPVVFVESNDGMGNGKDNVTDTVTEITSNDKTTSVDETEGMGVKTPNPKAVRTELELTHPPGGNDNDNINKNDERSVISLSPPLMNQLKSAEYIWLVIWFSIIITPLQYYIATIGYHMEQKGDTDARYTKFFAILYASSAIASPFLGKIIDVAGLGMSQGLATGLSAISLFILSLDSISLKAHVVGMAFYGIGRMMIYASLFSNVGVRFGYGNYGTLCGFALLVSGIVSLLQYPMIAAVTSTSDGSDGRNNSRIVNAGCGIGMICLLPYCIWLGLRERREQGVRH